MSGFDELKDKLSRLSVKLYLDGENLRVNAPKNALTSDILQDLKQYKNELMAELVVTTFDITPIPKDVVIPLSIGQKRLWSLMSLQANRSIYNVPMVHQIKGHLDVVKLKECLDQLQQRHLILRTSIEADHAGVPYSIVSESAAVDFTTVELKGISPSRQSRKVNKVLNAEIKHNFDLKIAPLWRCTLLQLAQDEYILAFTMHHIVFDLFSKGAFLQELGALYNNKPLSQLSIQYKDFAYWQQSEVFQKSLAKQMAYWNAHLSGEVEELLLPIDYPRQPQTIAQGDSQPFTIDLKITEGLNALCRAENVSMYMALLASFNILLNRYTLQRDQIICSPMACRNKTSIENLIGYFNNIIPMRTDLSGNPTMSDVLSRVRLVTIEANKGQDAPFMQISKIENLSRVPLTRGMFNFRMENSSELNLANLTANPLENRRSESDFDLALYMGVQDGQLGGVLDFNCQIFNQTTIASMLENYAQILKALVTNPQQRVCNLPVFSDQFPDIETMLIAHPKVDDALVVVRSDAGSHSHLVAYLVLNEHDPASQEELNAYVSDHPVQFDQNFILFPIDYFPYFADGSIDVASLPKPVISRKQIKSEYIAPRTELEKEVAEIWQRVLWMDEKVGINDDFFDLGGHSLLSVQMILELEKHLNKPISGINQLSTIANLVSSLALDGEHQFTPENIDVDLYRNISRFVAAWRGERANPDSLVVGLNTHGKKQPVFWCVQAYMNLEKIANGLGQNQPIYGMRSGHEIMQQTWDNIRQLAHYYVDEILQIQSEGPFIIGGICQASEIAFEMAVKLTEMGHKISLLVLQERIIKQTYHGPVALLFGSKSDRSPYYHFQEPALGWQKYYQGSIKVYTMTGRHGRYFGDGNIGSLTQKISETIADINTNHEAIVRNITELQILQKPSYSAELSVIGAVISGADLNMTVHVKNISSDLWRASNSSGVYLGGRWLDPEKVGVECYTPYLRVVGIRASFDKDLNPGDSIELNLWVKKPVKKNITTLEIDLVDEGITWFADQGSKPVRVEVTKYFNSEV